MSSYHQDLTSFEELLAYRNERSLTEWELEEFTRLIEKHPQFIERLAKDSQLESMLKTITEEEYKELGFKLPAKNIIKFPNNHVVNEKTTNTKSKWWGIAAILILSITTYLFVSMLDIKTPNESPVVAPSPSLVVTEVKDTKPLTPQEEYERQIAKIPQTGSMKRPPTKFNSATNGDHTGQLNYGRDIRPLLSEYCFHCHGPDEGSREADLRLDTAEGMLEKNAIVPNHPEKSEAIARMYLDDPDEIMPPPESHKTMTKEEKETIKTWISQGAKWERHWAYDNPVKNNLPKVDDPEWNHNPIDSFTYSKMKERGLKPNNKADRFVLARRLSLDLVGLPLPPEKIKKYVESNFESNYEVLVDELMSTKMYGEHRAHYWLDAARYGDTHGLHNDKYREMWLYRDWVINAFNTNMSFDQFTLEQFAGDLLPNNTIEQRIATGFHRCNVTSNEGGAIDEELKVRYNVDRASTTGMVFMGLTVGCAQCHDHKFDPITQKEFYQLFAFFNNTSQRGRDGGTKNTAPSIVVPYGHGIEKHEELVAKQKVLKTIIDAKLSEPLNNKEFNLSSYKKDDSVIFESFYKYSDNGQNILSVFNENESKISLSKNKSVIKDKVKESVLFNDKEGLIFNDVPKINPDESFSLSFWVKLDKKNGNATLVKNYNPKKSKFGWRVEVSGFRLTLQMLSDSAKNNNLYAKTIKQIPRDKWAHVVIKYSGKRSHESILFYVNGNRFDFNQDGKLNLLDGQINNEEPLVIGEGLVNSSLHHFKIYNKDLDIIDVKVQSKLFELEANLEKGLDKLKDKELDWFKRLSLIQKEPDFRDKLSTFYKNEIEETRIFNKFPTALVMDEKDQPAMAHILDRGEYDKKKEEVRAGVPSFLGGWKKEYPNNRLGLAKWIISEENPLTARVTVNRLWQEFFGKGLVATSDDFGSMGARPTHPKLLDWLAVEFIESGWDLKHMVKLIVTSKTYQQSSHFEESHLANDPDNKYLSKGPRFRLRAEAIRDQALAFSGLLVNKVGGKSVKPYQPAGLWKALLNTSFVQGKSDELYRRSLYTFWKRTVAPPSMAIFNAPSRETCIVKRENTNTPMQALTLMNDKQFVEASRVLAENMMREKSQQNEKVKNMSYRVLGYPIDKNEELKLSDAYVDYLTYFKDNPEHASEFISVGDRPVDKKLNTVELAAWTMLASTLMNRDDVINKN